LEFLTIPPRWNDWGVWVDYWGAPPILTWPNAVYWVKVWEYDNREECISPDCGSQWNLFLKLETITFYDPPTNSEIGAYVYSASFVMDRDQYFCYMPLLNRTADSTTMYWVGSDWCGWHDPNPPYKTYGWHPYESCPEGPFHN
jgi:hypothetical protein